MPSRALVLLFTASPVFGQTASFQWVQQIGGSGSAAIAGMATDSQGNSYIAGNTTSLNLPVTNSVQPRPGGSGLFRIAGPGNDWFSLYNSGASSVNWISVSGQHPQTILAASQAGILRTSDGGSTWTLVMPFTQSPVTVAFDPSNDALAYGAGGGWFFNSSDGGVSWGGVHGGPIGPIIERIWVDPGPSHAWFIASAGGLQRCGNGCQPPYTAVSTPGWQVVAGFPVLSLAFDPFTPGTIYAATEAAPEISTDDGLTWTPLGQSNVGYGVQFILADPLHKGTLYATSYEGIFRSADGGATWTQATGSYLSAGPMAADPASGTIYAAVGGNVYASTDGFNTVMQVGPASTATVQTLAVAGSSVFEGVASSTDVFVAKLDPMGNIIYATYFGGSGQDEARGLALDPNGAVYVTGTTYSSDFPVSAGAYSNAGTGFLFKLNSDGSFAFSTRFSTGAAGMANAIAVDPAGHAYIAGTTGGSLPVTPGAYQTMLQGVEPGPSIGPPLPQITNAFLMKFDTAGASLVFSTYIGKQNAVAGALAIEPDGSAVVAGGAAMYRIGASGAALLDSANIDADILALTIDSSGDIYAAGGTGSSILQATPGAVNALFGPIAPLPGTMGNYGPGDAFVAKFNSQLNLATVAVLGGEATDQAQGIAIAANGNIIVGGSTYSRAFPTRGTVQSAFSPSTGFVAELTPDLASIVFSTYAGDTRMFNVLAVAPTPAGGALFSGSTQAPSFNNLGGFLGGFDGFLPANAGTQAYVVNTAASPPEMPRIDSVVNAGNRLGVPIAAGETIIVTGAGFGNSATLSLNGAPIPVLAASQTTLTAAVPLDFISPGAVTLAVQSAGGIGSVLVPFSSAAPGIFSADGSGLGQGYILNADGTLNSPSNPAQEGSEVTIFATGVGPMTFSGPYAVTNSSVAVLIDGFWANGIAAIYGAAPGLPGNVYQVSVYVPQPSLLASQNPNLQNFYLPAQAVVTLQIAGATSQAGLSISVTH